MRAPPGSGRRQRCRGGRRWRGGPWREIAGGGDVLQGHLAGDEITLTRRTSRSRSPGRSAPAPRPRPGCAPGAPPGRSRRPVVPQLAQQQQELALAAADLDDVLAVQVVALDEALGQLAVKAVEGGREALGLLVAPRVLGERRVEGDVGDEAAGVAEAEPDLPPRIARASSRPSAGCSCWLGPAPRGRPHPRGGTARTAGLAHGLFR